MNELARFYDEYRAQEQRAWFRSRGEEYRHAHREVVNVTATLLFGATVVGILSAVWPGSGWLGIAAAGLPALSTALAAYEGLYGFERNAKLYGDALGALDRVRAGRPDPDLLSAGGVVPAGAVVDYVGAVEEVLRREQSQWGQLAREEPGADRADAAPASPPPAAEGG